MKKLTERELYKAILSVLACDESEVDTDELIAFVEKKINLLDKKKVAKQTKNADEVAELTDEILTILAGVAMASTSEIGNAMTPKRSTQKISPILNALAENGELTVTVDKRTKFYSLPDGEDVETVEG